MLCSGARSAGTPNNRLQRTALHAAVEPERWASANPDYVKFGFDRLCGGYK